MIGYYVHHHGRGHLTRARTITRHLDTPVVALTSLELADSEPFDAVVTLERDDASRDPRNPTAGGALHWVPLQDPGLRSRMAAVAEWIRVARPQAMIVDVSVEVATFARLMGVPTVVMAMPGERDDAAHRLVYDIADHIIAAWPRDLYAPPWLERHAAKTTYVGGVSRFDGRAPETPTGSGAVRVTVLNGAGGTSLTAHEVDRWRASVPGVDWTTLGGPGASWKEDPWPDLCAGSVVVTHAGQNAIADVAAAGTASIVVPQQRPFAEQETTAGVLEAAGLAVVHTAWPTAAEWPDLIGRALTAGGRDWSRWNTRGAAGRAAAAVERVLDGAGAA
ncbi:glycosyltransferase [Rhodococcus sp. SGAir0479]|uniref:glycosyltransferase n=1 Tax=Rhodococcus sp. SGAir0479 TaxID=2567884 RepID=UPI0010CCCB89|nr:glycosyltransferase [Rhodococcus sp. SGAir0479]QCQ91423.1 hypothetical protein E7742_09340 [Rhodococcus sp. SGAir0479]